MTAHDIHIEIAPDVLPALVAYCRDLSPAVFTIVADENTYAALGERLAAALAAAGLATQVIILTGAEVVADEVAIVQVMLRAPHDAQIFLAVGSGTITDIVRFVSHRLGSRFISVPTAPSVDGFISLGAALVLRGMKATVYVAPPLAVFADLQTLAAAPGALIAAGYGDIIGKFTALADWQLAALIWNEPFDAAVEKRVRDALNRCIAATDAIASRSPEGIRSLMAALLESGIGMLEFTNSRPASGSEHHCSHYWEIKLLEDGKPPILHGAKVGYATALVAQQYAALRALDHQAVMDVLEAAEWPAAADLEAEIRAVYGATADEVIAMQQPYLALSAAEYEAAKRRIAANWHQIQAILATVPPPDTIRRLMHTVGSATDWQTLGLEEQRVIEALRYAHHIRKRFTVFKLQQLLRLSPQIDLSL